MKPLPMVLLSRHLSFSDKEAMMPMTLYLLMSRPYLWELRKLEDYLKKLSKVTQLYPRRTRSFSQLQRIIKLKLKLKFMKVKENLQRITTAWELFL